MTQLANSTPWTKETIYNDPETRLTLPPRFDDSDLDRFRLGYYHRFTPEFVEELKRETTWVPIEDCSLSLPEAVGVAIGERKTVCPLCKGNLEVIRLHRGMVTGLEVRRTLRCICPKYIAFARAWKDVPSRFRSVTLSELEATNRQGISLERQAEIIALMQAHPADSYFLFGEAGTGKTHFATALYHDAVWRAVEAQYRRGDVYTSVWRVTASVLLNQHVEWERGNKDDETSLVSRPTITEQLIQSAARNGYRPCLFIDEIDKFVPSEFKLSRLGEIIDAVYAAEGQIVATSNKSIDTLMAKWGTDEALTILRRIGAGPNAQEIEFK